MRFFVAAGCAALIVGSATAQEQTQQIQQSTVQQRDGGPAREQKKKPLTKEEQRAVMQLLDGAEAGSAGLDSASRIVALAELARSYQSLDRKKSIELLETAFTATNNLQLESQDQRLNDQLKRSLNQRIVRDFVALAPERVDAKMDEVSADTRAIALDQLMDYYATSHQLPRAYDLVMRVAQEGEMPYGSAIDLMELLVKDHPDQVRSLFVSSLSSYQGHDHLRMVMGNGFPEMITSFQSQVPPALLKQAVDEVLAQAKAADDKSKHGNFSVSSAKGAVSFASTYDYRLFQLMPVLRKIDPQVAERLLKESQDVNTLASKYPDGLASLESSGSPSSSMTTLMGMGGGGPRGGPSMPSPLERQRMAQIAEDAEKHPKDALANAASLSPDLALSAYVQIAHAALKNDPSVSRAALSKAVATIDKAPLEMQMMQMQAITKTYMELGDTDKAKDALDQSLAVANRLYKKDTDADEPNTAPKAYWASTNGFRSVLTAAGKLDPPRARDMMKEIPDEGIRVFNQIALANAMLGTPATGFQVITATKSGVRMSFMNVGN